MRQPMTTLEALRFEARYRAHCVNDADGHRHGDDLLTLDACGAQFTEVPLMPHTEVMTVRDFVNRWDDSGRLLAEDFLADRVNLPLDPRSWTDYTWELQLNVTSTTALFTPAVRVGLVA